VRRATAARDVVFHRKAQLLLVAGRPRDALRALDTAIGLNPHDDVYWCDAALAWRALGRDDRARRLVDRALDLNPSSERAKALLAGVADP